MCTSLGVVWRSSVTWNGERALFDGGGMVLSRCRKLKSWWCVDVGVELRILSTLEYEFIQKKKLMDGINLWLLLTNIRLSHLRISPQYVRSDEKFDDKRQYQAICNNGGRDYESCFLTGSPEDHGCMHFLAVVLSPPRQTGRSKCSVTIENAETGCLFRSTDARWTQITTANSGRQTRAPNYWMGRQAT